ncbi:MAG: hypothetical protein CSA70_09920 [Rhodobacterales bacterium]|nr:MAG: hypothetical protein CSA70_09920 [Rhodobacterales bacterium]
MGKSNWNTSGTNTPNAAKEPLDRGGQPARSLRKGALNSTSIMAMLSQGDDHGKPDYMTPSGPSPFASE